jgi:predicted signal transduction protein with EAL and GGDEF domain
VQRKWVRAIDGGRYRRLPGILAFLAIPAVWRRRRRHISAGLGDGFRSPARNQHTAASSTLLKAHELSALNQQSIDERAQDSLTSCLNGPLFSAMVDAYPSLMGSRAGRQTGSLLMVDVDHLRVLNERIGHRAGDQALRVHCRGNSLIGAKWRPSRLLKKSLAADLRP